MYSVFFQTEHDNHYLCQDVVQLSELFLHDENEVRQTYIVPTGLTPPLSAPPQPQQLMVSLPSLLSGPGPEV